MPPVGPCRRQSCGSRALRPLFGNGHVMDPRAHIDAGRIGIFHRQIGPSPVAFAFRASPTAGLALWSRALRGGSSLLAGCLLCHGSNSFVAAGPRLPGDLVFILLSGLGTTASCRPPHHSLHRLTGRTMLLIGLSRSRARTSKLVGLDFRGTFRLSRYLITGRAQSASQFLLGSSRAPRPWAALEQAA